jgi:hypothetical protein
MHDASVRARTTICSMALHTVAAPVHIQTPQTLRRSTMPVNVHTPSTCEPVGGQTGGNPAPSETHVLLKTHLLLYLLETLLHVSTNVAKDIAMLCTAAMLAASVGQSVFRLEDGFGGIRYPNTMISKEYGCFTPAKCSLCVRKGHQKGCTAAPHEDFIVSSYSRDIRSLHFL